MSRTRYFSAELTVYRYEVTTVNVEIREFKDTVVRSVGKKLTPAEVMSKASTDTVKAISAELAETLKGIYRMTEECYYAHAVRSASRPRDRHERYITRTVKVYMNEVEVVNLTSREFTTVVIESVGKKLTPAEVIAEYNKDNSNTVALRVIDTDVNEYIYSMTEFDFMYYAEYVGVSR